MEDDHWRCPKIVLCVVFFLWERTGSLISSCLCVIFVFIQWSGECTGFMLCVGILYSPSLPIFVLSVLGLFVFMMFYVFSVLVLLVSYYICFRTRQSRGRIHHKQVASSLKVVNSFAILEWYINLSVYVQWFKHVREHTNPINGVRVFCLFWNSFGVTPDENRPPQKNYPF